MVRQASSRVRQFLAELEVRRFAERQVVVSCQITKSAKVIRILEVDAKVVFLVISVTLIPTSSASGPPLLCQTVPWASARGRVAVRGSVPLHDPGQGRLEPAAHVRCGLCLHRGCIISTAERCAGDQRVQYAEPDRYERPRA